MHILRQQQASHQPLTYGTGPSHAGYSQPGRKRRRSHDELHHGSQALETRAGEGVESASITLTPRTRHVGSQSFFESRAALPPSQAPPPQHHHHRMPNQPPPAKVRRYGHSGEQSSLLQQAHCPPSVVGQEGMPPPAARPRGPKLKFSLEDDQLLVDLKEKKNLTWKQIADFFPGRSSGTLQVRYCTKLKAKSTNWTDDMVSALIT